MGRFLLTGASALLLLSVSQANHHARGVSTERFISTATDGRECREHNTHSRKPPRTWEGDLFCRWRERRRSVGFCGEWGRGRDQQEKDNIAPSHGWAATAEKLRGGGGGAGMGRKSRPPPGRGLGGGASGVRWAGADGDSSVGSSYGDDDDDDEEGSEEYDDFDSDDEEDDIAIQEFPDGRRAWGGKGAGSAGGGGARGGRGRGGSRRGPIAPGRRNGRSSVGGGTAADGFFSEDYSSDEGRDIDGPFGSEQESFASEGEPDSYDDDVGYDSDEDEDGDDEFLGDADSFDEYDEGGGYGDSNGGRRHPPASRRGGGAAGRRGGGRGSYRRGRGRRGPPPPARMEVLKAKLADAQVGLKTKMTGVTHKGAKVMRELKGSVSSDLEKTLMKATRPDNDPAKRKHVNLLLQAAEHSFPVYMKHMDERRAAQWREGPYWMTLHKLWRRMAERDYRTAAKAVYVLHRLARGTTAESWRYFRSTLQQMRREDDKGTKSRYFSRRVISHVAEDGHRHAEWLDAYAEYVLLRLQSFSPELSELAAVDASTPHEDASRSLDKATKLVEAALVCELGPGLDNDITCDCMKLVVEDLCELWSLFQQKLEIRLQQRFTGGGFSAGELRRTLSFLEFYLEQFPLARDLVSESHHVLAQYSQAVPRGLGDALATDMLQEQVAWIQEELTDKAKAKAKASASESMAGDPGAPSPASSSPSSSRPATTKTKKTAAGRRSTRTTAKPVAASTAAEAAAVAAAPSATGAGAAGKKPTSGEAADSSNGSGASATPSSPSSQGTKKRMTSETGGSSGISSTGSSSSGSSSGKTVRRGSGVEKTEGAAAKKGGGSKTIRKTKKRKGPTPSASSR